MFVWRLRPMAASRSDYADSLIAFLVKTLDCNISETDTADFWKQYRERERDGEGLEYLKLQAFFEEFICWAYFNKNLTWWNETPCKKKYLDFYRDMTQEKTPGDNEYYRRILDKWALNFWLLDCEKE